MGPTAAGKSALALALAERLPVELVYQEAVPDRSAALRREAAIKRLDRRRKLALIAAFRPGTAEK